MKSDEEEVRGRANDVTVHNDKSQLILQVLTVVTLKITVF
jgi:hypothetical protein